VIFLLWFSFFAWLAVFYWETQQALQWWFQQQQRWLCQEAERVRNGLLQDTFVLRRDLEGSPQASEENLEHVQHRWLHQIQQLEGHLIRLSDDLSPPYLETSLPLSIRKWVQHIEGTSINQSVMQQPIALDLPSAWQPEPLTHNQIILTSLDYLLALVTSETESVPPVMIRLQAHPHCAELVVQVDYPSVAAAVKGVRSRELGYLRRSFWVLASGRSYYRRQQQVVFWHFRWRLSHGKVETQVNI